MISARDGRFLGDGQIGRPGGGDDDGPAARGASWPASSVMQRASS